MPQRPSRTVSPSPRVGVSLVRGELIEARGLTAAGHGRSRRSPRDWSAPLRSLVCGELVEARSLAVVLASSYFAQVIQ
jgi:hypothetical protein